MPSRPRRRHRADAGLLMEREQHLVRRSRPEEGVGAPAVAQPVHHPKPEHSLIEAGSHRSNTAIWSATVPTCASAGNRKSRPSASLTILHRREAENVAVINIRAPQPDALDPWQVAVPTGTLALGAPSGLQE